MLIPKCDPGNEDIMIAGFRKKWRAARRILRPLELVAAYSLISEFVGSPGSRRAASFYGDNRVVSQVTSD